MIWIPEHPEKYIPKWLNASPYEQAVIFFFEDNWKQLFEKEKNKQPMEAYREAVETIAYATASYKDFRLHQYQSALEAVLEAPKLSPHMQQFSRQLLIDECSDIRYAAAAYLNSPKRGLKLVANNSTSSLHC